jgi:hypothetical protein
MGYGRGKLGLFAFYAPSTLEVRQVQDCPIGGATGVPQLILPNSGPGKSASCDCTAVVPQDTP